MSSRVLQIGAEYVHMKIRAGVLELNDVDQVVKADVNCFFYFRPAKPVTFSGEPFVRFENIPKPKWVPHIDFSNEIDEAKLTDESFWLDTETGLVFGRMNFVPSIQERFDTSAFPFDRQVFDLQILINNCQVKKWEIENIEDYPIELSMSENHWLAQAELNAAADAWNLSEILAHALNDSKRNSSILHYQIFLERESSFYFWNIIVVYFIIIMLNTMLFAFPFDETRFEFALTLSLTTVAFMFVTTAMVPKTPYLTFMDKYVLSGLFLLFTRFWVDFGVIVGMKDFLPDIVNGRNDECDEDNVGAIGLSPCDVDLIATLLLGAVWLLYTAFIGFCTFCFPGLIRPSWKKINQRESGIGNIDKEIKGANVWIYEEREITGADLADSVNYEVSALKLSQSLTNVGGNK